MKILNINTENTSKHILSSLNSKPKAMLCPFSHQWQRGGDKSVFLVFLAFDCLTSHQTGMPGLCDWVWDSATLTAMVRPYAKKQPDFEGQPPLRITTAENRTNAGYNAEFLMFSLHGDINQG